MQHNGYYTTRIGARRPTPKPLGWLLIGMALGAMLTAGAFTLVPTASAAPVRMACIAYTEQAPALPEPKRWQYARISLDGRTPTLVCSNAEGWR